MTAARAGNHATLNAHGGHDVLDAGMGCTIPRMSTEPESEVPDTTTEESTTDERPEWLDMAVGWLTARWGSERPCPYCGNKTWTIFEPARIATSLQTEEWTNIAALPIMFPVSCRNCGQTAFVNLAAATEAVSGQPLESPEDEEQ